MQTGRNGTKVGGRLTSQPWLFAYDNSKVLSLLVDEPQEGWVTLAFTDESDPLALDSQMMYIPRENFDIVVGEYLKCRKSTPTCGLSCSCSQGSEASSAPEPPLQPGSPATSPSTDS